MKAKALKYLDSLVTDNTTKAECDLIAYCKKCVREYVEKERVKAKKFEAPTLQEVSNYVKLKGYSVDAQKFYDYYNVSDWHDAQGRPVKNWKLKLVVWDSSRKGGNQTVINNKGAKKHQYTSDEMDSFFDDISEIRI